VTGTFKKSRKKWSRNKFPGPIAFVNSSNSGTLQFTYSVESDIIEFAFFSEEENAQSSIF
jgi:hypothetical protein